MPFYKSEVAEPVVQAFRPAGDAMAYPADFKYTKDHEWIDLSGDKGRVGITDYAQQQLGDVVYVELPEVGAKVKAGPVVRHDRIGEGGVRALRAGHRRGRRGERGAQGEAGGRQHNPHDSWMVVVKLTNPSEAGALLDAAQYSADLVK